MACGGRSGTPLMFACSLATRTAAEALGCAGPAGRQARRRAPQPRRPRGGRSRPGAQGLERPSAAGAVLGYGAAVSGSCRRRWRGHRWRAIARERARGTGSPGRGGPAPSRRGSGPPGAAGGRCSYPAWRGRRSRWGCLGWGRPRWGRGSRRRGRRQRRGWRGGGESGDSAGRAARRGRR